MNFLEDEKCLIIAEAGVNHNGNLDLAFNLCDAAKAAGADVVKFQTWKTEKVITQQVEKADYQKKNTGISESQYDMLKKLELSYEDFRKIKKYCDSIGIMFASTGDTNEDIDFLLSLGIPFIKIGSGDICNIPYLRYVGEKKVPVLLSTGMSRLADVEISLDALRDGGASDIILLHCTTNYPCPYNNVNLKAMNTLKNAFGLPVGYSDHTMGCEVSTAAAALGAKVIEKHLTLDKSMSGPDHAASTEPEEFKRMVQAIRNIELALGDGIKRETTSEKEISNVVIKKIVANEEIKKGQIFTCNNLTVKRNDSGLSAKYWDLLIGKQAKKSFEIDQAIEWE